MVRLLHHLPPQEKWTLLIRSRAYVYQTEAECLAFLDGKYGNPPASLKPCLFDLQLHGSPLPRDAKYFAHPVIQHLNTGQGYSLPPGASSIAAAASTS